jgi:hypothetical protein
MDVDEARTVLSAGRIHVALAEWGDALHLLRPLHAAAVLQGHEQGEAAYLLGVTLQAGGDWDGGEALLREAVDTGAPDIRDKAETALSGLLHQEVANLAIQDGGGIRPDECPAVLAAADEAYWAKNWDLAQSNYQALYGGHFVPDNYRYAGALGLGRCEAYRGNYDVGAQYAEYVVQNDPNLQVDATNLLEWIKAERAGLAAAADGGSIDELNVLRRAADEALSRRDYDHAYTMYEAIANGPTIAPIDRAIGWVGMGWVHWHRGDIDQARVALRIGAQDGRPNTAELAGKILAALDQNQKAEHLIDELQSG